MGAEITTANVQNSFVGKTIFEGADFVSVSMRKGGATNNHEVDAISGGTKTCDGVNAMLETSISKYESFLRGAEVEAEADTEECCCGECSEETNVELNNEEE